MDDLCVGHPKEFKHLLNYSRKLQFEERPDYSKLVVMFRDAMAREDFGMDFQYDWIVRRQNLKARLAEANKEVS